MKIISKTDNIEIQDLKLNRGNCEHDQNFLVKLIQDTANAYLFASEKEKAIKNHQAKIARLQKDLEELTQYVQQFNNLDKLLENIYNAIVQMDYFKQAKEYNNPAYGDAKAFDKAPRKFKLLYQTVGSSVMSNDSVLSKSLIGGLVHLSEENDNPIHVVKRMLDDFLSNKLIYKLIYEQNTWGILHDNIIGAIEDTKNPKDYPYINLKELKKLIDSIVDDNGNLADGFLILNEYPNRVSKKGLQSLAKLKSMWPSVGKFYFAYLKEAIPRHAKEYTEKQIGSEEKSIKANQVKLTEAKQDIDKMEKAIKDLESKKNTLSVYLKFGESFTAHYKCQNLIEVGVKTDKGAWTFNFDR
ncbi:hypothetical protein [Helicobacter pylori]|uniref:hypothetical protein n=1 Tax=Helicobacter pylori TaxID=210 RepID=UPI002ED0189A